MNPDYFISVSEFLARLVFFSFSGVIVSILISVLFEYNERIREKPFSPKVWKRFVSISKIVIGVYLVSALLWLVIFAFNWITYG